MKKFEDFIHSDIDPYDEEDWEEEDNELHKHKRVYVVEYFMEYCVFNDRWVRKNDVLIDNSGNRYNVQKIFHYDVNGVGTVALVSPKPVINVPLFVEPIGLRY